MLRYLIGFIITIGLVILLIVLLFSGGGGDDGTKKVPISGKALDSYASTNAQIRLTIDGPINAEQTHRQVQITVDRNSAVMNEIQGYNGNIINTRSYTNSQAGFSAFLHALELLDFTKGDTSNGSLKSEAGHCAAGRRYIFEVIQDGHDIERFWATSCGGPHSFLGNVPNTIGLFQRQIPNYQTTAFPVDY